ncbi:hypothetical protein HRG_007637 [Hirsutella rhossiliensis]|uniref:Uncharacterized protein n=1 Tax=Hirsutella rhossiliensis TaxID=111463 RepID=A0A9P8MWA6_9HYPO|nr:uncharacterized protein HRG_07637 [Hirsutella rhossiliensis]KAH0961559.1 hypothetical protein HRG_07637 [Hirsutella rhossiliensis]
MPPRPGLPDTVGTSGVSQSLALKPPLPPTFPTRLAQQARPIELQLPPLIAGALPAAFAKTVAHALDNALFTHYYRGDQDVQLNLDRVVDRILVNFTRRLWHELYYFYHQASDAEHSRQVALLFEGPIRQIVLVLNGPETAKCLLDLLAPGLSRRQSTWSSSARGIDLPLALQLLCGYLHRERPAQFPGEPPDQVARLLHSRILTGNASANLISEIRTVLLSSHHVQMHTAESAIWSILLVKCPRPPPADGFRALQFKYACQLFGPMDGIGDPELVRIGSLPALTGTADECVCTTVSDYVSHVWPQCGLSVLHCLEEAVSSASLSVHGQSRSGVAVWDGADEDRSTCSGLRLIHVEIEETEIRMSVSARIPAMIQVFQQMSWTFATLSASPFPGMLSECAVDISNWTHDNDSAHVNCVLSHRPVAHDACLPWLRQMQGAAIASGFPIQGLPTQ